MSEESSRGVVHDLDWDAVRATEDWPVVRTFINGTPEVLSLLYDLDLMPEQIVSKRAFGKMSVIVGHFKAMHDRLGGIYVR